MKPHLVKVSRSFSLVLGVNIFQPQGSATFEELPFVLFGSFAVLSGLLLLLTPETLGTRLPDTMEEAEDIGIK